MLVVSQLVQLLLQYTCTSIWLLNKHCTSTVTALRNPASEYILG